MRIDQLSLRSKKSATRVGRGRSAGRGKTAGRGTKGQNARSGGGVRPGFEGGQNPLMQRVPKQRGFRSIRPPVTTVTTSVLNRLKAKEVTNETLRSAGVISSNQQRVKIVLKEPVATASKVSVFAMSQGALQSLESAGGEFLQTDNTAAIKSESPK